LRLRLWLGAAALGCLALAGAGFALLGQSLTEARAREALAAQMRLEAWATLSTRMNEWVLMRMTTGQATDPQPVLAALARIDALTADHVATAPDEATASARAADARHPAQLRRFFAQLQAEPADSDRGLAGLSFHLAHAPGIISARIEHETRMREAALARLDGLRRPLQFAALGVALAFALVLWGAWAGIFGPLFARLAGQRPGGHDELGLAFARLRRLAARLERRRNRLEAIVASRTADLQAANDRLAAIDASRRRFFADVSHELRTPLTVIMGEAELGGLTPDPDLRQSFDTIRARAMRLFSRIEDLLRLARSESGQLELQPAPWALAGLVDAARADLGRMPHRGGLCISADIPPDLVVMVDGDWLRQVLAGIFDNSLRHAGGGTHLHVRAWSEGDVARIVLADDGRDPPPMDVPILERFRRGPGGGAGFGVGLALAAWIIEASGGRIERLEVARGFALGLWLPLADRPAVREREEAWQMS